MRALIETVNAAISGGFVYYEPYTMKNVWFMAGLPPESLPGIHRIRAFRNQAKAKLFPCFSQGGAFVSNRNLNGYVVLTVARESPEHAYIQTLDLTGIGFPIYSTDGGTGNSAFVASSSVRVVNTPEWVKSIELGLVDITMACKNLAIVGGVRKRVEIQ
jgi:hypothetical protein